MDLIIPIATPAATAAAAAVQGTGIPLVYSAVTDPVGAQLADSMDAPGQNMTGTSDYIDTTKFWTWPWRPTRTLGPWASFITWARPTA